MKTCVLLSLALIVQTVSGQGLLTWGNNFPGAPATFRAPIYGTEYYPDAFGPISGQSSLGLPTGSTIYHAPLLSGTGYTFAVYVGPETVTDPSQLTLLAATTFRTSGDGGLPAGLVSPGTAVIPGAFPGARIKFQIRAWDNQGGTLTSWELASTTFARGASEMVTSGPLGGTDSLGNPFDNPRTDGWTSFSFFIPEPSPLLLAAVAGAVLGLWRRKR